MRGSAREKFAARAKEVRRSADKNGAYVNVFPEETERCAKELHGRNRVPGTSVVKTA